LQDSEVWPSPSCGHIWVFFCQDGDPKNVTFEVERGWREARGREKEGRREREEREDTGGRKGERNREAGYEMSNATHAMLGLGHGRAAARAQKLVRIDANK